VRKIDLTNHFAEFVDSGVRSGRFSDASEVVREGLRLLEQHERSEEAKLEWLRKAAEVGFGELERGEGHLLETPEAVHEFFTQVHAEARNRVQSKSH
jgi:antitoxin ParD1/3/4